MQDFLFFSSSYSIICDSYFPFKNLGQILIDTEWLLSVHRILTPN